MSCSLPKELIEQTYSFHGHVCPGVIIGIRVAELALKKYGEKPDLVAIVETDMCGVDAIQFLTSCTYGKGNLIHLDHGKMAFTFYNRQTNDGFRALLSPLAREKLDQKVRETLGNDISSNASEYRTAISEAYLNANLEELFIVSTPQFSQPRRPKVLNSLKCSVCNEMIMESRIRLFNEKNYCIPCFQNVEQKLVFLEKDPQGR